MPTNIDTSLTVQDAVAADHSAHIFTMSNGDLLVIYYDGTNLVWRSKSGGAWSAKTTITLDTGVTPPKISYWTRNNNVTGNVIYGVTSTDPIDSSHNGDFFELTYTPSTHTLAVTSSQVDAADGNMKAAGVAFMSSATANDKWAVLHGNAAGNFDTIQELNVDPTIVGVDQTPTFVDLRSTARTGLASDSSNTTYLMYGCASTGTAFAVEHFIAGTSGDHAESPPAPAANPVGITCVNDGTNYVFVINENNAKLRYLTRTGTNTYGSWTDILSDTGIVGQPAVCVKASTGDLAVFYTTTKNQANGEIWVVQRTSGVWGTPALFAGGAATGWSNPSCAYNDLNDSGNARIVYVTGTASTWTLVEDNYVFTTGGGGGGGATYTVTYPNSAHGQWPLAPVRITQRASITPKDPHVTGLDTPANATTLAAAEMFFGEVAPGAAADPVVQSAVHGQWPNAPLRITQRMALTWKAHLNADTVSGGISENDLTAAALREFYGLVDQQAVYPWQTVPDAGDTLTLADSASFVAIASPAADTLALAESVAEAAATTPTADSVTVADAPGATGAPGYTESVTLSETVGASGGMAPSDVLTLADTASGAASTTPSDTALTLSDAPSAIGAPAPTDTALVVTETTSGAASTMPATDALTLVDTPGGTGAPVYAESVTLSETVGASGGMVPSDVLTLVDTSSGAASVVPTADSVALSDAPGGTGAPGYTEAVTLSETVGASGGMAPSDVLTLAETTSDQGAESVTDTPLTLSESGTFAPASGQSSWTGTDSLTLADSGTFTLATTPTAESVTLAETSGAVGGPAPTDPALVLSDATTSASGGASFVESLVVVESAGATGSTNQPADSLVLAESVTSVVGGPSPTDVLVLTDATTSASGAASFVESLVVVEVAGGTGMPTTPADSLVLAETLTSVVGGYGPVDALSLAEAVTAAISLLWPADMLTLADSQAFAEIVLTIFTAASLVVRDGVATVRSRDGTTTGKTRDGGQTILTH